MATCKHGNTAPDEALAELHESQAGIRDGVYVWRHKCCICAFCRGEALGHVQADPPNGSCECRETSLRAPEDVMEALPKSQAGTDGRGRHQCAICALHAGFRRGRAMAVSGS